MYKHMIIPTDGSAVGTRAVERGLDLARVIGAKVTILTILEPLGILSPYPHGGPEADLAQQRQSDGHLRTDDLLEKKVRASGIACTHIRAEHSHLNEAVRMVAEAQDCDLVVMPAHERYGLLGRMIDSETVRLLSHSHLPVLVLH